MKRKDLRILWATVLASLLLSVCAIGASASFGSGAQVVAAEVNMIKTGLLGKRLSFSDADFKSALCLTDFDAVRIIKIPSSTEGTLMLDGRRVGEGKIIKRRDLAALSFIPASESVKECSFTFALDGYASGAEIECIMKFVDRVNYEPKVDGATTARVGRTQEGIPLHGTLSGADPEGDELSYIVVLYPKSGVLELSDPQEGKYCYTPEAGFVGEDSFTFVVRDEFGNYSGAATVTIAVDERMCGTVYRDMLDRGEYNAAVAMTAMNVMSGTLIGDDRYFMPDTEVSRAEFVAMALKCAGVRASSYPTSTVFDDDESISPSLKPYVSAAQRMGIVNGDFRDGGLYFSPNEIITRYEAASIMASILGYGDGGEERVFSENFEVPVWARVSVAAMSVLGIFDGDDVSGATETVTRADAADYLYRLTSIVK